MNQLRNYDNDTSLVTFSTLAETSEDSSDDIKNYMAYKISEYCYIFNFKMNLLEVIYKSSNLIKINEVLIPF